MSIKILVADDSVTIQKVIGIIFGGDEYSLTIVDNGKAAVDKALEIIPDILLIDALMPGMTGYEVTEKVRSTPSLASKPILILTGSFEPFDEVKAKKCGADDFIAKPFESQQIITKVKELLDLGRTREQSVPVSPAKSAPATLENDFDPFASLQSPPLATVTKVNADTLQPAEPADIWSAFTSDFKQPVEAVPAQENVAPSVEAFEPDVFAIVNEEKDVLGQTEIPAGSQSQSIGSTWVPIAENTFDFDPDVFASPSLSAVTEQSIPDRDVSFGDITLDDGGVNPVVPAFSAVDEPVVVAPDAGNANVSEPRPVITEQSVLESVTVADIASPSVSSLSTVLTEEQLKAVITSASREVIERIVWEVVPDLAETMIREAIRKIKEGVS